MEMIIMKKILCFVLCFLVLIGCSSKQSIKKLEIDGIEEITYEELIQNLNSNTEFMLYIGRPDCGDCQEFHPILEEYVNTHKGSGLYYLNIKEFRDRAKAEDASQEEKDFYDNLYKKLDINWVPTLEIISNGKIQKKYQYLDEDYYHIKDRAEQKERRQEFIDEFYLFMDEYFGEESN